MNIFTSYTKHNTYHTYYTHYTYYTFYTLSRLSVQKQEIKVTTGPRELLLVQGACFLCLRECSLHSFVVFTTTPNI